MFRNYLKMILRSMLKKKIASLIIIISFAVGLASINMIAAFVIYEYSTDSFNKNKDHIHRLLADDPFSEGEPTTNVLSIVPGLMKDRFPGIEDYCQTSFYSSVDIKVDSKEFHSKINILEVTPSFFDIFSFGLKVGNYPKQPGEILVNEKNAEKFFGRENPVGKELMINKRNEKSFWTVTGVLRDIPYNSHFKYDFISYLDKNHYKAGSSYLFLSEGTDPEILEQKFSDERKSIPIVNDGNPGTYHLQPLKDVYFNTQNKWNENFRESSFVFTFLSIGILILITACFNYLNLLKARFNDELKGMILRKLLGEPRRMNFMPLYIEVCIYLLLGLLVSVILTVLFIDYFNDAVRSSMSLNFISQPVVFLYYFIILAFLSLIFFMSMLYYYNSFNAVEILASKKRRNKKSIPVFQIVQFTISTSLIAAAAVIMLQARYINNKDIGFDRNVVEIKIPRDTKIESALFKNEILKSPLVSGVSIAAASPILEHAEILLHYDPSDKKKTYAPSVFFGDADYPSVLGLQLIAGNFFKQNINNSNNCIINESMVKKFKMDYPVGNILPGTGMVIIGVVKDFHFNSLTSLISPGYIICDNSGKNLLIKFATGKQVSGTNYVKKCWDKLIKDHPFDYQTLDKRFELMHSDIENTRKLVVLFAAIGIALSILGLFSYSMISVQNRKREIGIRKVLGSTVGDVVILLLVDFLKWILLATIISMPLVYDIMNTWLEDFAYRIEISLWLFALVGGIVLAIASVTVGYQAIKAATANPVKSLRYE